MIVAIHQPDYIPYLGYFYKMSRSDVFVFLDDCQFSNVNWHHWNRVKTPQGECRLKIPVEQHMGDFINQVRTRDELKWKEKHLRTLDMNYRRARYHDEVFSFLEGLILPEYKNLADMNVAINSAICQRFGFATKLLRSSEMDISTVREERVIDICTMLGGDEYLSGKGAAAYEVEEHFTARGVKLTYTDFEAFEYPQLWGDFMPCLSVVDYLFNCGFDWSFAEKQMEAFRGDR